MQTVNRRTLSLVPLIALAAGACISGAPIREQRVADPLATEFGQPRGQTFVSQGELILTQEPNLYDALVRTRPNQLRPKLPHVGPDTAMVVAYLDDILLGEVDQLRQIRTNEVLSVRFLSKVETVMKFGRSPVGGSIIVRTR